MEGNGNTLSLRTSRRKDQLVVKNIQLHSLNCYMCCLEVFDTKKSLLVKVSSCPLHQEEK